jgi:hypothetical protein
MCFCRHKFADWRPTSRDELGGRMVTRKCVKCQREQMKFASNARPHED